MQVENLMTNAVDGPVAEEAPCAAGHPPMANGVERHGLGRRGRLAEEPERQIRLEARELVGEPRRHVAAQAHGSVKAADALPPQDRAQGGFFFAAASRRAEPLGGSGRSGCGLELMSSFVPLPPRPVSPKP